jgi:ATP-binding cassette subfamily B protein
MTAAGKSFSTVRLAVRLVWASGRILLLTIIVLTVITAGAIAGQLLVGRDLLNTLADDAGPVDFAQLAPGLALLGVLLLVGALSQACADELRLPLGELVHRRTTEEILDVATEVELEEYEGSQFHDSLQRARIGAGTQSSSVVFGLVTIVSTLIVAFGVIAVLFSVAPVLVPVAVAGYIPITIVNIRNNSARYRLERDLTEVHRERTYLEFLMTERADAKEIRAYDVAPTLRAWHDGFWDLRLRQVRDLVRRRIQLTTAGAVVMTLVLVMTLSLVFFLAARETITIGDAAIAIVGLQQLNGRLRSAGVALSGVHAGVTFLRDFEEFRATLPALRAARPTGVPPAEPHDVTVEGVSYRYPGASVVALSDVSLRLRRGEVLAIVGANGSGKSTLAKLLCALLPPTEGTIRWDDVDIAECDPNRVRALIAPVFQDYTRYMFSIRRAIGLGDAARIDDDARVRQAVELAGLGPMIDALPDGLDTRLGKMFAGGTDVSIGEWQRIAIARALFRDAPFLLFDEPSASLDPRAESDLVDLLRSMCDDRIVVFVSHRFSTVRSADVVLVLDQGQSVEMGSHEELMSAGGLYHELYTLQAQRYGFEP